MNLSPGKGERAVMARANWSAGYLHAQIVHDLLEELGYEVTDPANNEDAPDRGYQRMAEGETDLWANSWYPGHEYWWQGERVDGSVSGDHLVRLDRPLMAAGGIQGLLITKSWADANGISTLDQIAADETLWRQLDHDGDGLGDIFGCPADWTCDDIIRANLVCNGWNEKLEHIGWEVKPAGSLSVYDTMFIDFLRLVEAGQPAIVYTWTPTEYFAKARPGDLTMWLSMEEASVNDENCGIYHDGDQSQHRDDGTIGFGGLGPDVCLIGPDGCQLGFLGSDIEITANKDWLTDNPPAEELLTRIQFDVAEISELVLLYQQSAQTPDELRRLSRQWRADHHVEVEVWLDAARRAASN